MRGRSNAALAAACAGVLCLLGTVGAINVTVTWDAAKTDAFCANVTGSQGLGYNGTMDIVYMLGISGAEQGTLASGVQIAKGGYWANVTAPARYASVNVSACCISPNYTGGNKFRCVPGGSFSVTPSAFYFNASAPYDVPPPSNGTAVPPPAPSGGNETKFTVTWDPKTTDSKCKAAVQGSNHTYNGTIDILFQLGPSGAEQGTLAGAVPIAPGTYSKTFLNPPGYCGVNITACCISPDVVPGPKFRCIAADITVTPTYVAFTGATCNKTGAPPVPAPPPSDPTASPPPTSDPPMDAPPMSDPPMDAPPPTDPPMDAPPPTDPPMDAPPPTDPPTSDPPTSGPPVPPATAPTGDPTAPPSPDPGSPTGDPGVPPPSDPQTGSTGSYPECPADVPLTYVGPLSADQFLWSYQGKQCSGCPAGAWWDQGSVSCKSGEGAPQRGGDDYHYPECPADERLEFVRALGENQYLWSHWGKECSGCPAGTWWDQGGRRCASGF